MPNASRTIAAVVVGALLAAGCGSSTEPNPSVLQPTLTATASATDVALVFTVTNTTTAPVRLDFNSGQQYDFIVRSNADAVVWQWSAGMGFTQALTSRTLAPGETAAYTEHWTPTAKGSFAAQAVLTTSSSPRATASTTFTVP
jgi:hypothetical protein